MGLSCPCIFLKDVLPCPPYCLLLYPLSLSLSPNVSVYLFSASVSVSSLAVDVNVTADGVVAGGSTICATRSICIFPSLAVNQKFLYDAIF